VCECVYAHANSHLLSEKGSDGTSETDGENDVLKKTEIGGGGKKRGTPCIRGGLCHGSTF